MKSDYQQTDPALEMALLIRWMMNVDPSSQPTWQAFSSKLNNVDGYYNELIAIITRRINNLMQLMNTIHDVDFDSEQRKQIIEVCSNLLQIFSMNGQAQEWNTVKSNFVKPSDAIALTWFSHIVQRYRPLLKFDEEQIAFVERSITEMIESLMDAQDIPAWCKPALLDGLHRTLVILKHVKFFGHEAVFSYLVSTSQSAAALKNELQIVDREDQTTLWNIIGKLAIIITLFNAPDQTMVAYQRYQGFIASFTTSQLKQEKPQLLLPPPVEVDDEESDVADGSQAGI